MKLVSAYQTVTIESSLTKTQLQKAQKYVPEACSLVDEKKNPVFSICATKSGSGCIDNRGVEFDSVTADDKMFITVVSEKIPADATARKSYIEDNFGTVLFKLQALETQIAAALDTQAAQIASVADSIILN